METVIVEVRLGHNSDGSIRRTGTFMILANEHSDIYPSNRKSSPSADDKDRGRFKSEWDGTQWQFECRVWDA
jgi:hypothetical protein